MNVPFTLADPSREREFLTAAAAAGLRNLEGHRSVGGMRASLYNAMPLAGVQALVGFMQEFARVRG
jgi:phosphoserine aminotransferase